MDVLDRVQDLLGDTVMPTVMNTVIDTVREEYGGAAHYIRSDRGVRIRRFIRQGASEPEIMRQFHLRSVTAVDYHRRML